MAIKELTYFWMASTANGKVVPQFTRDGVEQKWDDVLHGHEVTRIYWMPFDVDSASVAIKSKTLAFWPKITNNTTLWLDIPKGAYGIPISTSDVETMDYWHCERCGGDVYWHGDDGTELHCPACEVRNEWLCEECHAVINNPTFKHGNKVECPIHDGQGLIRTKNLTLHKETYYRNVFALAINKRFAMEYDENGRFIRKYIVGDLLGQG